MIETIPTPNQVNGEARKHIDDLLPGTTFPKKQSQPNGNVETRSSPVTFDGPSINGRPTTVTRFTPDQLAVSPLLQPLCKTINLAFGFFRDTRENGSTTMRARLRYDGQLLDELRNAPGVFTFVISYTGTDEIVATGGAKRHNGTAAVVDAADLEKVENTFKRMGPLPDNTTVWELSLFAVDPTLQRQGIAGYLMKTVEEEVMRHFMLEPDRDAGRQLLVYCTTIKEKNEAFYVKRGYRTVYEVAFPAGHIGSPDRFTVIHMSKKVDVV